MDVSEDDENAEPLMALPPAAGTHEYRLQFTPSPGTAVWWWRDAQTFLEAKIERQPKRIDGTDHPVEVY